ncbi:MAG: PilN domain-containing protein [Rhodobacteraceae bacterium]|nr:PilN domain-containing protein [Paracoccaceae bacterium]
MSGKALKTVFAGIAGLFPARFVNPGMLPRVGRVFSVGIEGKDAPAGYDFLVSLPELETSLHAALTRSQKRLSGGKIISLQLSPSFFLVTPHNIPKKAARYLNAVLSLFIRQNTPFSSGEIVWRHRKVKQSAGAVSVEQFIIKTQTLDALNKAVSKAGLRLKSIELVASDLVFQDHAHAVLRGHRVWRSLGGLAFSLAVAFALLSSYFNYQNRVEALATITAKNGVLQDRAVALREAAQSQESEAAHIGLFLDRLGNERKILQIFEALTHELPDTTWLSQFNLRQGVVRMAGFSTDDPSALVIKLAQNPDFEQVVLSGPITRDQHLGQNRFEMTFKLVGLDE